MANLGLILMVVCGIGAVVGAFLWNYYSRKINEKIFVTPSEIIVPANASREVPVVVTNNLPYPVFMVVLEIKVIEGDLDLTTNFSLEPRGVGGSNPKYLTIQIPQMNGQTSWNLIAKINGHKYDKSSKLKLSIVVHFNEPTSNFTVDSVKELPKTIKLPDGFVPEVHKPDTNQ